MANLRVAILGSQGRMGRAACAAVSAAHDLELVAEVPSAAELSLVSGETVDVAVDLTIPAASPTNVAHCVSQGVNVVVGTTGWTPERLGTLQGQLATTPGVGVLIAPNFAIGAVLAMHFAKVAARYFESAEVIELHHPDKLDAPSGTARHTAAAIAETRSAAHLPAMPDATTEAVNGARGALIHGIPVHSVRLRGLVAHEEILFGNPGEQLTVRHDSFDRVSFMPGVLQGIRMIGSRPGLTVGLENFLDLG